MTGRSDDDGGPPAGSGKERRSDDGGAGGLLDGPGGDALRDVASRVRVLFAGGKGGVGKTTVASTLALAQARAGRRVLLVSTDPAHNLGHLWGRPLGDHPTRLTAAVPRHAAAEHDDAVGLDADIDADVVVDGHHGRHRGRGNRVGARDDGDDIAGDNGGGGCVDGVEIDPEATVERHLAEVGRTLRRLMPERLSGEVTRHLELAREAPGTHEAAVLERIADAVETGLADYDLVVFDTAPSGHTARLMALPETMSAWTEGLLRRQERSARFGAALRGLAHDDADDDGAGGLVGRRDPRAERDGEIRRVLLRRRTRFERLREVLTDPGTTSFVLVLAAERLPVLETIELHEQLAKLGVDVGALVVNKRSPAGAGALLDARRAREEEHLRTLSNALPVVPRAEAELLPTDVVGEQALASFAGLR
jgi:arsenite-transporting ATPase